MTDWTRHDDDPHVWIFKDKYTLRCEHLTWYLYVDVAYAQVYQDGDGKVHDGDTCPKYIDHIHTPPDYYHQPHFAVPRAWAEIVVNMHEAAE